MSETTKDDGGPLYPSPDHQDGNPWNWDGKGGASLRDYFAGMAMQGMLAMPSEAAYLRGAVTNTVLASHAYEIADRMLEARK